MTPEFTYFLKVNVAFVLFYAFYRLLFYKDTFFKLRRVSLLAFFGVAILYPLLNIQEWMQGQKPMTEVILMYSAMMPEVAVTSGAVETNWKTVLISAGSTIYWGVVALLFVRFLVQLISVLLLIRHSKRVVIHRVPVYRLNKPMGPFSFFRMIFIHPESHSEEEIEEILTHECTHASQWHSVDVMICELITVMCWINPFAWLLKREVRHNLEYLADQTVIQSGHDSKSYQYHLLGLACHSQAAATFYNNFNVLHLKNRISMMNKKRSHGIGRAKYLVFIPLVFFLMLLSNIESVARITGKIATEAMAEIHVPAASQEGQYSDATTQQKKPTSPQKQTDPSEEVYTVVEVMPEFPGGQNELLKFLAKSIKYPVIAQQKGLQGRVIASFIVGKDGVIRDIQVMRGVDPVLDEEAVRVISTMPKWQPGKQRGKEVAVKYTVPLSFRLSKNSGNKPASDTGKGATGVGSPQSGAVDPSGQIFRVAEKMPQFPGGQDALLQFLSENIVYPVDAQQSGTQGRVICVFVINTDGSISDAIIGKGVSPSLDQEALRIINAMPKWIPATQKGKAVRVQYTVPVTFKLQ